MPKFKVYGGKDAYAIYSTIVEADTADEARRIAERDPDANWVDENTTQEFDDFTVFTEEGSVVPVQTWSERVAEARQTLDRPLTLAELIKLAEGYEMTPEELEAQRQSWARQTMD